MGLGGFHMHVRTGLKNQYLSEEFMGLDQYSAVLGVIEKYNVPVIMDADVGHLPPMMPLVTGSLSTVTYEDNNLRINMEYK